MADEKESSVFEVPVPLPKARDAAMTLSAKGKLPVMPLAVLLPSLGKVSELHRVSERLQRRMLAVQEEKGRYTGEEGEDQQRRLSEESMLNQVMQWLSIGASEE